MALTDQGRVAAEQADRARAHRCPGCGGPVVLKRGRRVVAHFAHQRSSLCAWSRGETYEHLGAKQAIAAAFAGRGLATEIEAVVLSGVGDRRADVLVRQPSTGARVAIEIQHSPLSLEAVERRTRAYLAAGVAVVWVATLDPSRTKTRVVAPGVRLVDRYAAPDWQRFAAAYHGDLWFWIAGELWRGSLEVAWVSRTAQDDMAEAGWAPSRRWAALTLRGPYAPEAARIALVTREVDVREDFALPGGRAARLVAYGGCGRDRPRAVSIWRDWSQRTRPMLQVGDRRASGRDLSVRSTDRLRRRTPCLGSAVGSRIDA